VPRAVLHFVAAAPRTISWYNGISTMFSIHFLYNVSHALVFFLFIVVRRRFEVPNSWQLLDFGNKQSRVERIKKWLFRDYFLPSFFKIPSQITQHSNFPVTTARDRANRGKGTTVHNVSRLAALHKTAAGTSAFPEGC